MLETWYEGVDIRSGRCQRMKHVYEYHLCLCYQAGSTKAYVFRLSVRAFVRSPGYILLPRYLMNALNNFDKTGGEYSVAPTDDLVRFLTSWPSR